MCIKTSFFAHWFRVLFSALVYADSLHLGMPKL
jgi:hypothetical protein